jgi:hypothetical protein
MLRARDNSNGEYSNVHLFFNLVLTQTGMFYSNLHRRSTSLTSARTWKTLSKHISEQNTSETARLRRHGPEVFGVFLFLNLAWMRALNFAKCPYSLLLD